MLTFLKIIGGCRVGDPEAWQAMVAEYTPVLMRAVQGYQCSSGRAETAWRGVLGGLADDEFAALKAADVQSDREFLALLRGSLLDRMAAGLEDDPGSSGLDADPALEALGRMIKSLPLLHQNIVFLSFAGYSEPEIEQILRVSPAIARDSLDRLSGEFGAEFGQRGDTAEWKAVWLKMIARMRASRTGECVSVRRLIRILDGQAAWQEKEPVENHLAVCLHCTEAWVGLQEIAYAMRRGTPLAPEQVDELISALPLRTKSGDRRSLFKRAFH